MDRCVIEIVTVNSLHLRCRIAAGMEEGIWEIKNHF